MQNKTHRIPGAQDAARLVTLAACAFAPAAFAQSSPTLALPTESWGWQEQDKWTGTVGLGATVSRGNNDSTTLTANGDAQKSTQVDRIIIKANAVRSSTEGARTANNALLSGRYEENLNRNTFAFLSADLQRDPLADLTLLQSYGGGFGRRVINEQGNLLNFYAGVAYTIQNNIVAEDRKGADLLLGNDWTYNLSENAVFKQSLAYYPGFGENARRAIFQSSVTSKLVGPLALQVSYLWKYNGDVTAGVSKTDSLLTAGVTVKF
ncbi:DUF481 domain-containing protein [Derxia gummosa]|uniref:DUF481 domain-containing protein n=1 Tax=Derxia gummosa DSM 723 TaxID=1121388 RepID=A0A8B6X260_9BURK|nr:DUF481 domain-containing protein [Derxia gummosa]